MEGKKFEDFNIEWVLSYFSFCEYVNHLNFIKFQEIDRYPKARKKDIKAKRSF
jgi:hypothetical protein